MHKKLPGLNQVKMLEQLGLGKLTISCCTFKHIRDPVDPDIGWQVVLAMYIKEAMTGVNCLNKSSLRSTACKGYVLAVEILFVLRNFPSPVDFTDEFNWTKTIIYNLEREENIACQRKPLDNKIHAQLITQAKEAGVNSLEASVVDGVSSGKVTG